jgi:vacuolar-type H+-ATPase subunit E/Vma4
MPSLFEAFENWLRNILTEISQQQTAALLERIVQLEEANRVAKLGESGDDLTLANVENRLEVLENKSDDFDDFEEKTQERLQSLSNKTASLEDRLDGIDVDDLIDSWMDSNLDEQVREAIRDMSFEVTVS